MKTKKLLAIGNRENLLSPLFLEKRGQNRRKLLTIRLITGAASFLSPLAYLIDNRPLNSIGFDWLRSSVRDSDVGPISRYQVPPSSFPLPPPQAPSDQSKTRAFPQSRPRASSCGGR